MAKAFNKKRGFKRREPKEFEEEVIKIDRVTRVVKGGRKLRFRATVVIGNKKGKVGVGIGKSVEVTGAIQKAIAKAKRNLVTIKLHGTTIPHEIKIKFKAAKILFLPAGPGTGIIAGGTVRKVLELTGVKDILSKCYGTTNKVNNTKAAFEALKLLEETPAMIKEAAQRKKKAEERKASPRVNQPRGNAQRPHSQKPHVPRTHVHKASPKKTESPKKIENTKKIEKKEVKKEEAKVENKKVEKVEKKTTDKK